MIYLKFTRPQEQDFTSNKTRSSFSLMFVPPLNHPQEKYCYVEIPDEQRLVAFLEDFGAGGADIISKEEMPDNFFDMAKQRTRIFSLIQDKNEPDITRLTATLRI